jgi:hypothetical protein
MASAQNPRTYHASALLLPDGSVLVAGSGGCCGAPDQFNAEIFSPPYLFRGPRPQITSAPSAVQYGNSFAVGTPNAAAIASVALIRTGAMTHGFDHNQRYVPLTFSPSGGGLTVQAPPNGHTAPPGEYLLFIVDTNGVPSVAPFVRLQ